MINMVENKIIEEITLEIFIKAGDPPGFPVDPPPISGGSPA